MSLTTDEQALYDFAKNSLPRWLFATPRAEEELGAFVKIFNRARQQIVFWASQTYLFNALGASAGEPDWLEQHAHERGTGRQLGETNAALAERLRNQEDALTRAALLTLINAMLDAAAVTSNNYGLVELRRDRGFMVTRAQVTGVGAGPDAFTKSGTTMTLTLAAAPFEGWMLGTTLTLTGATSGANNGSFPITAFVGDAGVRYTNASGVVETFGGTWKVNAPIDGRKDAYLSRGYRMTSNARVTGMPGLLAILPYPTAEGLRLAVVEALRLRKMAGIPVSAERRLNP